MGPTTERTRYAILKHDDDVGGWTWDSDQKPLKDLVEALDAAAAKGWELVCSDTFTRKDSSGEVISQFILRRVSNSAYPVKRFSAIQD